MNSSELQLLTRDEFRNTVFNRDRHLCVFCGKPAVSAHHIMERRLFTDVSELGGYFTDNGASVCEEHHLLCERTEITVEETRTACKITDCVIPLHLYKDQRYDKWGNIILPNGSRLKGELFHDGSVQKALYSFLPTFIDYVKYPRTYHLPWSPGINLDDRQQPNTLSFKGQQIVVTKKMDGEQFTMYKDYCHARSIDSENHPSRNWAKNFHAQIAHDIPQGWRICAENLYAQHSIPYLDLESFVLAFSIWNEQNICLDWDETLFWFELIGIKHPEVLYEGEFSEDQLRLIENSLNFSKDEGYILRIRGSFPYQDFSKRVAKYVRPDHVQTSHGWKSQWKPNKMLTLNT